MDPERVEAEIDERAGHRYETPELVLDQDSGRALERPVRGVPSNERIEKRQPLGYRFTLVVHAPRSQPEDASQDSPAARRRGTGAPASGQRYERRLPATAHPGT